MASGEDALVLLRSIDTTLKALLALSQKRVASRGAPTDGKAIAPDRDLDGKYGDPELKFQPRDWSGPSFKGRHYSECPPELLDLVAESCEYFARKAEDKDERTSKGQPVADFRRQDAARARGWAARMRNGTHQAPHVTEPDGGSGWTGESEWQ